MTFSKPTVAVIVTVRNEEDTIELLLDALRLQTWLPQEVIVTDGGSSDQTHSLLQRYAHTYPDFPLKIVEVAGSRSLGRNTAVDQARSTLIAVTDAGCVPDRNWLENLVKKYLAYQQNTKTDRARAFLISGYYRGLPHTLFERAQVPYVLVPPEKVDPDTFLPSTRSLLISKALWQSSGGLDESLSLNEDYEFATRLHKQGVKMVFAKDAIVSWMPRKNITEFIKMLSAFAEGDIRSQNIRFKVIMVFARYYAVLCLVVFLFSSVDLQFTLLSILLLSIIYSGLAIKKNLRSAGKGWFWLPFLQWAADWAVLTGTLRGLWVLYQV